MIQFPPVSFLLSSSLLPSFLPSWTASQLWHSPSCSFSANHKRCHECRSRDQKYLMPVPQAERAISFIILGVPSSVVGGRKVLQLHPLVRSHSNWCSAPITGYFPVQREKKEVPTELSVPRWNSMTWPAVVLFGDKLSLRAPSLSAELQRSGYIDKLS